MSNQRYFNFPVCLLIDFLTDTKACLNNIINYSLYAHSLKEDYDDGFVNFIMTCEFYDIDLDEEDTEYKLNAAQEVYEEAEFHAPKVGLNLDIFWDFYKKEKSDYEKVCLLAFLAIKSILGNKAYCKTDNKYLLSRMNGSALSHDLDKLPEPLQKYSSEYMVKKIKNELKNNWGLRSYSRYTRGFYVSYTLKLESLMYEAEKKRKMNIEKQRKLEEKAILEKVLKKLANNDHQ